jgi:hypothetical protein
MPSSLTYGRSFVAIAAETGVVVGTTADAAGGDLTLEWEDRHHHAPTASADSKTPTTTIKGNEIFERPGTLFGGSTMLPIPTLDLADPVGINKRRNLRDYAFCTFTKWRAALVFSGCFAQFVFLG